MSKVTTNFWLMMAILIALVVGFWAADYAGSITGSVWVAAGAGVALAIAIGWASQFVREEAEQDETWLNRSDWIGVYSKMAALVAALGLASFAIDQIVNSAPDDLGFMDYGKSATGGWIVGILIFGLWTWAKNRKSDITQ